MAKFDISKNAYRLPNGRMVTSSDDLSTDEIKELVELNATAYDLLRLRSMQHELANAVSTHITTTELMFADIKEMLLVDLSNGTPRERVSLGQAFKEMYDREKSHRYRILLWDGIKKNRFLIATVGAIIVIGLAYYFDKDWILATLIPFLISMIKDIFTKK